MPDEILLEIVRDLEKSDLGALRLTCKHVAPAASQLLLDGLTIPIFNGPPRALRFRKILHSANLKDLVRNVRLEARLEPGTSVSEALSINVAELTGPSRSILRFKTAWTERTMWHFSSQISRA